MMAKILHTADLHLRGYGDERWEALQQLVNIGKKEKIDLMAICGDLFNKGIDSENLRNEIRKVFDNTGFKVAILPGNHDRDAFSGGKYFGKDVQVITDPDKPFACKDLLIWGLPFAESEETETVRQLRSISGKLPREKCNLLLYHGELLDPRFSRAEMGEEGDQRYMPVRLSYFDDLGFKYILAGHFHTNFRIWQPAESYFIYPGSPVSVTRKESGRRKVNLFQSGEPPQEYLLETFHYERVVVELDPLSTNDPVEEIKRCLNNRHSNAQIELFVMGYIDSNSLDIDETRLAAKIDTVISEEACITVSSYAVKDIREILKDRLFERFMVKLEEREKDEQKQVFIRDLVIQAMLEARG